MFFIFLNSDISAHGVNFLGNGQSKGYDNRFYEKHLEHKYDTHLNNDLKNWLSVVHTTMIILFVTGKPLLDISKQKIYNKTFECHRRIDM